MLMSTSASNKLFHTGLFVLVSVLTLKGVSYGLVGVGAVNLYYAWLVLTFRVEEGMDSCLGRALLSSIMFTVALVTLSIGLWGIL